MAQLALFVWLQLMPPYEREMLRRVLSQWRHYFGQGPSSNVEEQAWAADVHRLLGR